MSDADVRILNYALTLEYLELDFYERGADADMFSARERDLLRVIRDLERRNVAALISAIWKVGGTPDPRPAFQYPGGTFTDRALFLAIAAAFDPAENPGCLTAQSGENISFWPASFDSAFSAMGSAS